MEEQLIIKIEHEDEKKAKEALEAIKSLAKALGEDVKVIKKVS